jgi:dihydroneopterin aldolase
VRRRARAPACDTDRIADTIDYGALRLRLQRLLQEHRVQLLEALAEQVARIAIDEFQRTGCACASPSRASSTTRPRSACMIERRRTRPPPRPPHADAALIGQALVPGSR